MIRDLSADVDRFLETLFVGGDATMDAVSKNSDKAGLPAVAVSPLQGAFLCIIAGATGARRILEIGALGGYSTIWLARGLPTDEGVVKTLEIDPKSAALVRSNANAAGLGGRIEVIEGQAARSLETMVRSGEKPFDLVFIDADKENYPLYLDLFLSLTRKGALIIADNAVWEGEIANEKSADARVKGLRAYLEKASAEPRLGTTVVQTIGVKGHDGFAFSLVR